MKPFASILELDLDHLCWKKFGLGIGMGCPQLKLKHLSCILFFFKMYFYIVHNPEICFYILLEYSSVLPVSHHILNSVMTI